MDKLYSVLEIVLPVVLSLCIGVYLRKKRVISPESVGDIKTLLSSVCIPAVIFSTFYAAEFDRAAALLVFSMTAFTIIAWLLGFGAQKLLRIDQTMAPYLCTSIEGGMLGFALFILLFGQENLYYMALYDLGNALVLFPFFLTKIRLRTMGTSASGGALKALITPINVAIFCGLLVNLTGVGARIAGTGVGAVLDATLSFLSAPVSALILLTVGYGLDFSRIKWGETFRTIAARAVIFAVFGVVFYKLFTAAFPGQPLVAYATIMAFLLPPTFMYSVPIQDGDESAYVGSVLAIYTILTLIGFVGLTWLAA